MPRKTEDASSLPRRKKRGVYFCSAPEGMVRVIAVNAAGIELANLLMLESLYEEHVGEWLKSQLDAHDPPARPPLVISK